MLGYRLGGHAETLPYTCVTLGEKAKISYSTWPNLPHSWIRKALSNPCFCFQSHFAPTHPTKTISIICYIILMLQSLKVIYEGKGSYTVHNLTVAPTHTPSSDRQRCRCQRSELTCFPVQCLWGGGVGLQTRTISQTLQPPVPLLLNFSCCFECLLPARSPRPCRVPALLQLCLLGPLFLGEEVHSLKLLLLTLQFPFYVVPALSHPGKIMKLS